MTLHPKPSLTVETSPLFLQTLGPWFPKDMQNLLLSENITLAHSAAVQFFFLSLAQARSFWHCLFFKTGLTQGMKKRKPMSHIRLYVVVLEALTPAAVYFLWISRVWLFLLLVNFFLPHLFFPVACLLMCLDWALWTANLFSNGILCLALLVQGFKGCLLDSCQVSGLPHDCVAYRTRLRDYLRAFAGVLIKWAD